MAHAPTLYFSISPLLDCLLYFRSENERNLEEYAQKEKVLKEMIHAKDNSIIALTNQVRIYASFQFWLYKPK